MKKIVYVTGCCGFIGSYITAECLGRGWYVKGIDKMTYASSERVLAEFKKFPNFSFEKMDINDLEFLYDCDYVINSAAETHVDNSIVKSDDFIHSNIHGVYNLLELIRKTRGNTKPVFFHISTDEVYGDIQEGSHKETDMLKPSNPYSATKAAGDMLVKAWSRTYDIPYMIVRPTNNYGIGQYVEKLIPRCCKSIFLGKKIPVHNNGTPMRVWLHARDTALAIVHLVELGVKNEIFNISGNLEQSNIDTINKVIKSYFTEPRDVTDFVDFSFSRKGQDVRYSLDDSKLRATGWNNTCDFDKELPKIVNYYKNNFIW